MKIKFIKCTLAFTFWMLSINVYSNNTQAKGNWPKINEFNVSIGINTNAPRTYINIPIIGLDGNIIYSLICHGGSQSYLDRLGELKDIIYVPPLNCALYLGKDETENSLLSEDDSPSWHTRGQFYYYQLLGKCANYPEFGLERNFKLRGFELKFLIYNVETDLNGDVTYFNLNFVLKNNQKNISERAEQPGYIEPTSDIHSCDEIKKGYEDKMCRNEKNDWEKCQ